MTCQDTLNLLMIPLGGLIAWIVLWLALRGGGRK